MKLYSVVDKKSCCAEYFIASCDEDAVRIWFVMLRGSAPMREFLEDFELLMVRELDDVCVPSEENMIMDGIDLKRRIEEREELQKNAVKS